MSDVSKPEPNLYFFPESEVTDSELREILASGERGKKAWAISHLMRYAQWDDIWKYTSRDEVRDMFPDLELGSLTEAWARMLKVDVAPVG